MRIRVIDAFAERPFTGNPAGVCLVERWPEAAWMQAVAAELNLSETAFAHPRPDGDWALRWFTPTVEVDLCGHATLATAHALFIDGLVHDVVRFHTRSGVLSVRVGEELTLDLPAAAEIEPAQALDDRILGGAKASETFWVPRLRELLAVFDDSRTVRELAPDLVAIAQLDGVRGVIVTAQDSDFVSRVFLPSVGIPEDPVTGGAHTALAPFWARRLGRDPLVAYQASARGGILRTRVRGDRVELTGRAVTVIDGALLGP